MKIHMVPLDYEHVALPNKIDLIKIFGRTQEGKSVCLIDEITNYFYVLAPKKVLDKVEDLLKKARAY